MHVSQPTQRADGQVDNRRSDGGYPLDHSPDYDGYCRWLSHDLSLRLDPVRRQQHGRNEPIYDEVGSFSMTTVSAVYPLVGSFSMKKWTQFA
jgi:hypothetical protein